MSDTVKVNETAYDVEGLFEGEPWPPSVTVRYDGSASMGTDLIIQGDRVEVIQFIRDGWGDDEADSVLEWLEREQVA